MIKLSELKKFKEEISSGSFSGFIPETVVDPSKVSKNKLDKKQEQINNNDINIDSICIDN